MTDLYSHQDFIDSPLGTICIRASERGITDIIFSSEPAADLLSKNRFIKKCKSQLQEYFEGKRKVFDLEIDYYGTQFQKLVWLELLKIRFGSSISYLALASRLGNKNKIRAVAKANSQNRISIIVPCHRIIGANGELVGYSGGLWRKKWLLEHEENIEHNRKQLSFFET
ncbi:MAG TPA: methylated-DNA--[protein]-cysteine S-methyltransferase [Melioribacteraceae bacterium]|nr:methylated-DNA--[protein]-cysteine S-methyltransferase [Melioribacteraceae bacterium]